MPRYSGWGRREASGFTPIEGAAAQVGDLGLGSIVVFFDRLSESHCRPAARALSGTPAG